MSKKLSIVVALLVMVSMVLAACSPAASPTPTEVMEEPTEVMEEPTEVMEEPTEVMEEPTEVMEEPTEVVEEPPADSDVLACQVTDTGGIDDKSFNQSAWNGFLRAQEELGVEVQFLESQQQTDYERNINALMDAGCDLIVTVGFLLGDATAAAAEANPDQNFAIVDYTYDPAYENVLGLAYSTHQAAFMAGYLAAGVSETGVVGTFGGLAIPTVTIFMDGFYLGVQHYNEVNGTDVQVLGWDPETQEGLFVGNFESLDDGANTAQALMDEGADVIMPVAGPVGLGAAAAVQEAGTGWIIGVDTDWTVSSAEYTDVILTSVEKRMNNSVFDAVQAVVNDNFEGGVYVGTLENEGVGLGTISPEVPAELVAETEALADQIISGEIQSAPENAPYTY